MHSPFLRRNNMQKLSKLEPKRAFKYFEEITAIPRGSGNMEKISEYCLDFAEKNSLEAVRDEANNVVIFKAGSKGYENSEPVILQGHLDMVCQKEEGCSIDFEKDGLDIFVEGDYIKAKGTTLGADNGIAVAMILAILESKDIAHPPIEAVFTTDEEIGMVGAIKLKLDKLKGRKMINIDSEDPSVVTVSCAGGSDFKVTVPFERKTAQGKKLLLSVKGLKGGHSGVEINSGRVNSNILMARILNYASSISDIDLISIDGGDKGNAIPLSTTAGLLVSDADKFLEKINAYAGIIKNEISARESGFEFKAEITDEGSFEIINPDLKNKLIFMLLCAPNGVTQMSAEIEGLVETSLNLGILKTEAEKITMLFALRSNKQSALDFLEEKLKTYFTCIECQVETGGHYPPWEFNGNSKLREIYKKAFCEIKGFEPKIEAIHAGLECGVFSSGLKGLDCISIGPEMHDIHTVKERLSISSTKEIFEIVLNVLKECK